MSRRRLRRIRDAIISGEYDLTRHAIDEMAEDGLSILILKALFSTVKSQRGKPMTRVGRDTLLSGCQKTGNQRWE